MSEIVTVNILPPKPLQRIIEHSLYFLSTEKTHQWKIHGRISRIGKHHLIDSLSTQTPTHTHVRTQHHLWRGDMRYGHSHMTLTHRPLVDVTDEPAMREHSSIYSCSLSEVVSMTLTLYVAFVTLLLNSYADGKQLAATLTVNIGMIYQIFHHCINRIYKVSDCLSRRAAYSDV